MITWTEWLTERLQAIGSPYADLYHNTLESHFAPVQNDDDALDRYANYWPILGQPHAHRTVKDGNTSPINNDSPIDYNPALIDLAGTNHWNWQLGVTEACFLDYDYGHGGNALDDAGIRQVDQWAGRLPYAINCTSKSGKGRHWLIQLTTPLPAKVRGEHAANCRAVMQRVSADLGVDLDKYVCSCGGIQYIYARKPATGGLQLIKSATGTLTVTAPQYVPPVKHRDSRCDTLTPQQQQIIDRISAIDGFACGWTYCTPPVFHCHTAAVARAGFCTTDSPGRDGATPNAYIVSIDGGLLLKTWRRETADDWWERDGKFCCWLLEPADTFDKILDRFIQTVAR